MSRTLDSMVIWMMLAVQITLRSAFIEGQPRSSYKAAGQHGGRK